ncbi:Gfo/Idh/MocA family protein [Tundrisphaera sp. TA3]|uniref:Gfo/Idh/MocA family protein n=1 Tax=Tundrisphaera sp. TA3 TaxID=3435775 RepID=UPI003EBAD6D3
MIRPGSGRLRIGVIGLGRLWEARHKPALARMADRFRVTAVYDQVARRAELEAAQLGAAALTGLSELIDRPDVDAVYLLAPQWFGLHAIDLAAAAGKPIYCALPLASDPDEIDRLDARIRASGVAFMPEFARRFYPASLRLRELIATRIGAPRLVVSKSRLSAFDRSSQPGPSTQIAPNSLLIDPGSYLLAWCRFVFQSEPVSVQGWGGVIFPGDPGQGNAIGPDPDYETFLLEFAGGAAAQVSVGKYHRGPWGDAAKFLPPPGIQVYAERGVAWLEMPDRIHWTDESGTHQERLPMEPSVGEVLNDHFLRLVRGEPSLAPGWDDALAVARLIGALRQSRHDGRRIEAARPR